VGATLRTVSYSLDHRFAAPDDDHLEEARESLAYWEDRARRLPVHNLRGRREAREMAARWRARVADAERERYGRGLSGVLLQVALERRLPAQARHAGRTLARRTVQVAIALTLASVALALAAMVVLVEIMFG
jgi:hypothetical protein